MIVNFVVLATATCVLMVKGFERVMNSLVDAEKVDKKK